VLAAAGLLGPHRLGFGAGGDLDARAAAAPPATDARAPTLGVYVNARARTRRVPASFLGLSFELSSLPRIATYYDKGDLVKLLRSLGHGVLRFGGVSADTRAAWSDEVIPPPAWASVPITPTDLRRLALLAKRSGWSVLLTIGLVHFDPVSAGREAAAARATLGRSLIGIELGNEPDSYMRHGLREAPWTFSQYNLQAAAYQRAIATAAPGVPLAGPDVSGSAAFLRWGPGEAARLRPELLTGHHYPLGCHDVPAPSIPRLLSAQTRHAESVSTRRYMAIARASDIRFRMDETNTVSCGGRAGVSDTFASALWAVSYMTHLMQAGVAGVNFHGEPANCQGYTPLCGPSAARLQSGGLSARPEWYALLLARNLLGDSPLQTTLRRGVALRRAPSPVSQSPGGAGVAESPTVPGTGEPGSTPDLGGGAPVAGGPDISVTALAPRGGGVHVVLVDADPPGARAVLVHLHVPRGLGAGRLLAMTAPSTTAGGGVRLGGRAVQADGTWREPRVLPALPNRRGVIALTLPPASAALVTVAPAHRGHG
jgi:hypothetical protein